MRGLVTLATALSLPSTFPERDLIVLSAFAVVLGTLVVQGLTLRPLIRSPVISTRSFLREEVCGGSTAAAGCGAQQHGGSGRRGWPCPLARDLRRRKKNRRSRRSSARREPVSMPCAVDNIAAKRTKLAELRAPGRDRRRCLSRPGAGARLGRARRLTLPATWSWSKVNPPSSLASMGAAGPPLRSCASEHE